MKKVLKAKPAAKPKAKPAASSKARSVAKPAPRKAPAEPAPRATLVRDSFTMPEDEYAALARVKARCLKAGIDIKKAELLRLAFAMLDQATVPALRRGFAGLAQLKTGRPPKA